MAIQKTPKHIALFSAHVRNMLRNLKAQLLQFIDTPK